MLPYSFHRLSIFRSVGPAGIIKQVVTVIRLCLHSGHSFLIFELILEL